MYIDTVSLIDQTIENLQLLSALFADELDERLRDPAQLSPEARRCRDALGATQYAIATLQAARSTQAPQVSSAQRVCANCDEL